MLNVKLDIKFKMNLVITPLVINVTFKIVLTVPQESILVQNVTTDSYYGMKL